MRGVDHVSASGVANSLGFSSASRGVQQKEQLLRLHFLAGARGGFFGDGVMPPLIASRLHGDGIANALEHQNVFHFGQLLARLVDIVFQGNNRSTSPRAIACHNHFALCVMHAVHNRACGKASKDHAVRRANARAGKHGESKFWNHAHVQRDHIAFANAHALERVGNARHFVLQFFVGDFADFRRVAIVARGLAFPQNGNVVALTICNKSIDRVETRVGGAARKPFGIWTIPLQHCVPRLVPVKLFRNVAPENFRIVQRLRVQLFVGGHVGHMQ